MHGPLVLAIYGTLVVQRGLLSGQHVPERRREPPGIYLIVAIIGAGLVLAAALANQAWLDRHFLPSWFIPHRWYVAIEWAARVLVGGLGTAIILYARPRPGRVFPLARVASIVVAGVLAMAASEAVLRRMHLGAAEWLAPNEEPRRRPDPRLGWTFVPSRTGQAEIGGRVVEYSFDAEGHRVRRLAEPVDVSQPSILFVGESVMFGEGLTWEESIPAQVGGLAGIQSANLAVHGFGTDQMYLRVEAELPRFRRPVAVVVLYMTALFGRNLDDDRPHLGPGLVWSPAVQHGRLAALARLIVPYRTDATVARGVEMTRAALNGIVRLARMRGAAPLIVVPHFGAETAGERALRRRVLDEAGLSYLFIGIDDAWRLPWDRHPNARAATEIARRISERLRQSE